MLLLLLTTFFLSTKGQLTPCSDFITVRCNSGSVWCYFSDINFGTCASPNSCLNFQSCQPDPLPDCPSCEPGCNIGDALCLTGCDPNGCDGVDGCEIVDTCNPTPSPTDSTPSPTASPTRTPCPEKICSSNAVWCYDTDINNGRCRLELECDGLMFNHCESGLIPECPCDYNTVLNTNCDIGNVICGSIPFFCEERGCRGTEGCEFTSTSLGTCNPTASPTRHSHNPTTSPTSPTSNPTPTPTEPTTSPTASPTCPDCNSCCPVCPITPSPTSTTNSPTPFPTEPTTSPTPSPTCEVCEICSQKPTTSPSKSPTRPPVSLSPSLSPFFCPVPVPCPTPFPTEPPNTPNPTKRPTTHPTITHPQTFVECMGECRDQRKLMLLTRPQYVACIRLCRDNKDWSADSSSNSWESNDNDYI